MRRDQNTLEKNCYNTNQALLVEDDLLQWAKKIIACSHELEKHYSNLLDNITTIYNKNNEIFNNKEASSAFNIAMEVREVLNCLLYMSHKPNNEKETFLLLFDILRLDRWEVLFSSIQMTLSPTTQTLCKAAQMTFNALTAFVKSEIGRYVRATAEDIKQYPDDTKAKNIERFKKLKKVEEINKQLGVFAEERLSSSFLTDYVVFQDLCMQVNQFDITDGARQDAQDRLERIRIVYQKTLEIKMYASRIKEMGELEAYQYKQYEFGIGVLTEFFRVFDAILAVTKPDASALNFISFSADHLLELLAIDAAVMQEYEPLQQKLCISLVENFYKLIEIVRQKLRKEFGGLEQKINERRVDLDSLYSKLSLLLGKIKASSLTERLTVKMQEMIKTNHQLVVDIFNELGTQNNVMSVEVMLGLLDEEWQSVRVSQMALFQPVSLTECEGIQLDLINKITNEMDKWHDQHKALKHFLKAWIYWNMFDLFSTAEYQEKFSQEMTKILEEYHPQTKLLLPSDYFHQVVFLLNEFSRIYIHPKSLIGDEAALKLRMPVFLIYMEIADKTVISRFATQAREAAKFYALAHQYYYQAHFKLITSLERESSELDKKEFKQLFNLNKLVSMYHSMMRELNKKAKAHAPEDIAMTYLFSLYKMNAEIFDASVFGGKDKKAMMVQLMSFPVAEFKIFLNNYAMNIESLWESHSIVPRFSGSFNVFREMFIAFDFYLIQTVSVIAKEEFHNISTKGMDFYLDFLRFLKTMMELAYELYSESDVVRWHRLISTFMRSEDIALNLSNIVVCLASTNASIDELLDKKQFHCGPKKQTNNTASKKKKNKKNTAKSDPAPIAKAEVPTSVSHKPKGKPQSPFQAMLKRWQKEAMDGSVDAEDTEDADDTVDLETLSLELEKIKIPHETKTNSITHPLLLSLPKEVRTEDADDAVDLETLSLELEKIEIPHETKTNSFTHPPLLSLPKAVREVLEKLGPNALLVGGATRGGKVNDYDIVVKADDFHFTVPEDCGLAQSDLNTILMKGLIDKKLGSEGKWVGINHPVYNLNVNGIDIQVSLMTENNLDIDVAARDLTCNSRCYSLQHNVFFEFFGSEEHIPGEKIVFNKTIEESLKKDPSRIFRVLRLLVEGYSFANETDADAMKKAVPIIQHKDRTQPYYLNRNKLYHEMSKCLMVVNNNKMFSLLQEYGVLEKLFGHSKESVNICVYLLNQFKNNDTYKNDLRCLWLVLIYPSIQLYASQNLLFGQLHPNWQVNLTLLFKNIGIPPVEKEQTALLALTMSHLINVFGGMFYLPKELVDLMKKYENEAQQFTTFLNDCLQRFKQETQALPSVVQPAGFFDQGGLQGTAASSALQQSNSLARQNGKR